MHTDDRFRCVGVLLATSLLSAWLTGCTVGPDYRRPDAPTARQWLEAADERVVTEERVAPEWWHAFDDEVLDQLIETAQRQNYSLQAAGWRVLEAQARRGIAVGGLFPQTQTANALYSRRRLAINALTKQAQDTAVDRDTDLFTIGFDASWEVDLWGRLRRGVEAADAELLASVATYDDVLVSLIAEVATTYVQSRVLEERLALAQDNVRVQREGLRIATARFEEGGTSELDVQQATTLLADTEASIPELQSLLQQSHDRLSVLIGIPAGEFAGPLPSDRGIPGAPPTVAVAIPADLVRRRPDVRRAERQMAAQSARIGSTFALMFPRLEMNATIGLSAEQATHLFDGDSFQAVAGPRFDWPILNYGRLINGVRAQDAVYQQAVMTYAGIMLQAQREVEDALIAFLRGHERVQHLQRSVAAANRAVEIALIQYREGAADYTRVLTAQQSKLRADDALTSARGAVTLSVIALYRALGGGWEVREGKDFIDDGSLQAEDRRWWGHMADAERRQKTVNRVQAESEEQRPWWNPRWWWPEW